MLKYFIYISFSVIFSFSSFSEPLNIILFIGDGMGSEHRKAARWASYGLDGILEMDNMPVRGLIKTLSLNSQTTDSAAASTAMACGIKTKNGILGLTSSFESIPNIAEFAKKRGMAVGIITTDQICGATPAGFAVHVKSRNMMTQIAEKMIFSNNIDLLFGGGESNLLPSYKKGFFGKRGNLKTAKNFIVEMILKKYTYINSPVTLKLFASKNGSKVRGIFASEGMTRPFSPTLSEMLKKALTVLSDNSKGFFLMVEAAQIDWGSHANNAADAISSLLQLDSAVRIAKEFAKDSNNTLVIVTADHETGGLSANFTRKTISDEGFSMPNGMKFYINWTTKGHTNKNIPITALGPMSQEFKGIHENTFIHTVIINAIDGKKKL